MFDSTNFPWMQSMSAGIKTIGRLFCFNMFASLDGTVQHKVRALLNQPGGAAARGRKGRERPVRNSQPKVQFSSFGFRLAV